jgi:hypothetical protein
MEKDDLEIERQRIELERQKLELERQKLEFEKTIDSTKNNHAAMFGKSPNIAGIVLGLFALVSVFLPWISSFRGSLNMLSDGFVKFIGPYGYFCVLISLGMIVLSFMRFKYAFLLGILNLTIALIPVLHILDAVKGLSQFFEGGFGLILFFVSGILYTLVSLIDLRSVANETSEKRDLMGDLKKIVQLYKSELILAIACLFVLISAFDKSINIYTFSDFFWTILWFCIIPAFVFYRLKMKKTFVLFLAYPIFITMNYLYVFVGSLFDGFTYSPFGNNLRESLTTNFSWLSLVFYVLIFLSIGIEYLTLKEKYINERLLKIYNRISKPIIYFSIIYAPLVISMVYYSFARTNLLENDYKSFNERNSYLEGDWFLLNSDSTEILVLRIAPTSSSQEEQYSSNVRANMSYSLLRKVGGSLGYGSLDTIVKYSETIKLPLKFKGLEIISQQGETINIAVDLSDGSQLKSKAFKTDDKFTKIIETNETKTLLKNMIGAYSGSFGDNEIMLKIEKIDSKTLSVRGKNTVSGNTRPLEGTIEILDNVCYFVLNEPGDDQYDGVFEFKIYKNSNTSLQGTWRSNDGTLTRDFRLYRL